MYDVNYNMTNPTTTFHHDALFIKQALDTPPNSSNVALFQENPYVKKLSLSYDIAMLQQALHDITQQQHYDTDYQEHGFHTIALTQRPGQQTYNANDMSGRYYARDNNYIEQAYEDIVDEAAFSEFNPIFANSYFHQIYQDLSALYPIGRMRILTKDIYNCNSWHRDPEPRIHIPIISNPGSLFIVNNYCTHLPADGSVYFTDTRHYHTALNGGSHQRTHIVAAIASPPITE